MDIQKLLEKLQERSFEPFYFEHRIDAINKIVELVGEPTTIGSGGSMTIKELGILEKLEPMGHKVYSHAFAKPEERDHIYQLAQSAKVYISSTNALTEQGELVNIDGAANRVSALCFGPKTIIYVLGTNKIVKDVTAAIDRIRNYAAPKNCVRLNKNTPCAKTGRCSNCNSDGCICNQTLITHHPTSKQDHVYVIIINEELGY